jgi:hypothetical protein
MRKYGINVVSLWPYSIGINGPERAIRLALEAGYDGIQGLPMKWWSYTNISMWGTNVISYEDAFMYGSLWQAVLRQLGFLTEPAPLLVDWLLFGQLQFPELNSALYVTHQLTDMGIVEISPGLGLSISEYIRFCANGGKLCWDTMHVRSLSRTGTALSLSWEALLEQLPATALALIHVHLSQEELPGYLKGEASETTRMLQQLGQNFPNTPVIIEVFPSLLLPQATVAHFCQILAITKKWLG